MELVDLAVVAAAASRVRGSIEQFVGEVDPEHIEHRVEQHLVDHRCRMGVVVQPVDECLQVHQQLHCCGDADAGAPASSPAVCAERSSTRRLNSWAVSNGMFRSSTDPATDANRRIGAWPPRHRPACVPGRRWWAAPHRRCRTSAGTRRWSVPATRLPGGDVPVERALGQAQFVGHGVHGDRARLRRSNGVPR